MSTTYARALTAIDAAHAEDPNKVTIDGTEVPYELHYAQLMSRYLQVRQPSPSDCLSVACRAQHFRRWEVPRSSYPEGKAGYFAWRAFQKNRQAEQVQRICIDSGFSQADAERVGALIAKEGLKRGDEGEEEVKVLEDVACLVFLKDQFDDFEKNHNEEKIVSILQKTWGKMSSKGQELALGMDMTDRARALVQRALES